MKAYPIIGGPLDGLHATSKDFYREYKSSANPRYDREGGIYANYARDYCQFNNASRGKATSMVFLYVHDLKPAITEAALKRSRSV